MQEPDIECVEQDKGIIVRIRLSIQESIKVRDEIKKDYCQIPKLNKTTFDSFATWVYEEIDDALAQNLIDFYEDEIIETNLPNKRKDEDDEPSKFEVW
jgi:hypothetical protein